MISEVAGVAVVIVTSAKFSGSVVLSFGSGPLSFGLL